ncbi:MAG: hypothetical protein HYX67_01550 [Candidatus Melainabacteria bacterium]|nr:hypothetical protein [Candidatus Melainabacteria bacterium]
MNFFFRRLALLSICVFAFAGCTEQPVTPRVMPKIPEDQLKKSIIEQAHQVDQTVVDGWFFGQEPRLFKSAYRKTTPEQKADFAMDYAKLVADSGQQMDVKWDSYIPYSKRREFAIAWWSDPAHDTEYLKQDPKYQVLWIHEALLDGSELWWRSYERLGGPQVPPPAVLAHDAEQSLVSKYSESDHNPGSFSTQPR